MFVNCSVQDALVNDNIDRTVVSGGAAVSIALVANVSIDGCTFRAEGELDSSGTSTGLLVLASRPSRSRTNVSGSTFESSVLVLTLLCVDDDGVRSVPCAPSTQ